MTSEGRPADPVRRRSRAPTVPTIRVDRRSGARDSGQSSGASALDLFRVAHPQPPARVPTALAPTRHSGLLGSRAWRGAASPRGQMPPRILSGKSSKPGPPVAALNAHCQGQERSGRPSCSVAGAWLVGQG